MPRLDAKKLLKQYVENYTETKPSAQIERETDELFLNYMDNYNKKLRTFDKSYEQISKFFDKSALDKEKNTIYNLLQRASK